MKTACPHSGAYTCFRCNRCYSCGHTYVFTGAGHFWQCPDGFEKRALPEGAASLKWWEIDPKMTWSRLLQLERMQT